MTKVALVEDSETIRTTFRKWLEATPGYECVAACASAEAALAELPALAPDIVLMDIHLPGSSGIACTAQLKTLLPKVQVIMVTVYKDHDLIFQALRAGACGYLLKRAGREDILRAIAEVQSGGAPMTGEIARRVIEAFQQPAGGPPTSDLTAREREVLQLLATGMGNKQIAARLNISIQTVCVHLRNAYEKLHVHSRTEAILKYLQSGSSLEGPVQK